MSDAERRPTTAHHRAIQTIISGLHEARRTLLDLVIHLNALETALDAREKSGTHLSKNQLMDLLRAALDAEATPAPTPTAALPTPTPEPPGPERRIRGRSIYVLNFFRDHMAAGGAPLTAREATKLMGLPDKDYNTISSTVSRLTKDKLLEATVRERPTHYSAKPTEIVSARDKANGAQPNLPIGNPPIGDPPIGRPS